MNAQDIKEQVRKRYAEIAVTGGGCCCEGSSCDPQSESAPDSLTLPEGANLGLSCGSPVQYAELRPGETVVDLGCGAGVDVFRASPLVGPQGLVIGVDMTAEMIRRAQENAAKVGFTNVEFRLGEIENLPLEDNRIDVILSNCVINLVPDKAKAFAEIYRVLKPGGRFIIADIVTSGEVPQIVREDMTLWTACLAGAMQESEYLEVIRKAGFHLIAVCERKEYPLPGGLPSGFLSLTVKGFKP